MTHDARTRLLALLMRVAPGLAAKVWAVGDVRKLPTAVRREIANVLGNEAAERGFDRYGRPKRYGDELDLLAEALDLEH